MCFKNKTSNISEKKIVFTISSMADALSVHQRTLRIYDKEGLLRPKRTYKNQRCYNFDDFKKAKLILFMTRNFSD